MSETSAAPPRSRRRILLVAGIVVVLLVLLAVVAWWWGGRKASEYSGDFTAWNEVDKAAIVEASSTLPKGTYDVEDSSSTESLAAQEKGCDAVGAARKTIASKADDLPTLGAGALGMLRPSYRKAADLSERRAKVVDDHVEAARKTFAQIERDCRWNIAYNKTETKSGELYRKAQTFNIKRGTREPGSICNDKDGCVSSITRKKNRFADLRKEATTIALEESIPVYESDECRRTSYGDVCTVIATGYRKYLETDLRYDDIVRKAKSTISNKKIGAASEETVKVLEEIIDDIREELVAKVPELEDDKKFVANPSSTDRFFSSMASLGIEDLRAAQDELDEL